MQYLEHTPLGITPATVPDFHTPWATGSPRPECRRRGLYQPSMKSKIPEARRNRRGEAAAMEQLEVKRREETLAHRVVGVADAAHRGSDACLVALPQAV